VNAQRLSRIAAGIAIATALGVVGIITRNVLWPDDPDASLQRAGGKVLGDMTGYVGRIDRESRTVDVSVSPLGIRPVAIVLTNETAIVVNGKQGAIGDLWKDLPVRVYYEVRDNTRYATSIQVTAGDAVGASLAEKDPAATTPAGAVAGTPSAAPATVPASSRLPPGPSAATANALRSPAPIPSRPTSPKAVGAATGPVVPAGARVTEPTAELSRAVTMAPASESASVSSSAVTSPGTQRPAPAEPEADGSAAIDWLLKGAGRR